MSDKKATCGTQWYAKQGMKSVTIHVDAESHAQLVTMAAREERSLQVMCSRILKEAVLIRTGHAHLSPIEANTPIDKLRLSVRAVNILKRMKIYRLNELLKVTEFELMVRPGCGEWTVREIQDALAERGLGLPLQDRMVGSGPDVQA